MQTAISKNYQNLDHLLAENKRKKDGPFTHTRIGDVTNNIYGGSYFIPDNLIPVFYDLYYKKVFDDKEFEYLTEVQDKINGGPLLVDIDMRFPTDVTTRQYNITEISDILELYSEALFEIFNLTGAEMDGNIIIPVYVFEKDDVTTTDQYTKDGLHFVFGIHMKHSIQMILRDVVIQKEKDSQIFENLGCINTLSDIFDECISSGRNNWQIWGSRKPGNQAYKLTQQWNIIINGQEYSNEPVNNFEPDIKNLLPIISARNKDFLVFGSSLLKTQYKGLNDLAMANKEKKKKNRIICRGVIPKNVNSVAGNINIKYPTTEKDLD